MKATIFILICSFIPALAADLVMRNGVTYNDVEPYNSDDVGVTIRYGPTIGVSISMNDIELVCLLLPRGRG